MELLWGPSSSGVSRWCHSHSSQLMMNRVLIYSPIQYDTHEKSHDQTDSNSSPCPWIPNYPQFPIKVSINYIQLPYSYIDHIVDGSNLYKQFLYPPLMGSNKDRAQLQGGRRRSCHWQTSSRSSPWWSNSGSPPSLRWEYP